MSNQKINYCASTPAPIQRASDLAAGRRESAKPRLSYAKSPPCVRSLTAKLETNHKRGSLSGHSAADASTCRRHSTQPRAAQTGFVQNDSRVACGPAIKKGRCRRSKIRPPGKECNTFLLGGGKKPTGDANHQLNDDPTLFRTRPDTRHGPSCNTPREHFKTGKQYYRHLKKSSISPPFGFEHITHTLKEQIPGIDSVNETDLTASFWAATSCQRPRPSLRGIQAHDLPGRRLSMAFASIGRSRSASHDSRRRSAASTSGQQRSPTDSAMRKDSSVLQPAHDRRLSHDSTLRSIGPGKPPAANQSQDAAAPRSKTTRVSFQAAASVQEAEHTPEPVSTIHSKRVNRTLPPLPEQSALSMDESWEDDVDFCYEQEAEATCDFDWETATALPGSPPKAADTENRDSVWSTTQVNRSPVSPSFRQSTRSPVPSSESTDQPHRRGSSVGHRGFLAARTSNMSLSAAANLPPTFQITPDSNDGSFPSARMNLAAGSDLSPKSPKSLTFSNSQPTTLDELSDPESTRTGGSRHRKSSSFGSSGSSSARSTKSNGDGNRWSLASFASVPELLYSHRRNKTSITKMRISAPLEQQTEQNAAGRADFENPRGGVSMRRPQTPGDRAALQAAGRASQRGRSLASDRQSPPNRYRTRETSTLGNGPEWI